MTADKENDIESYKPTLCIAILTMNEEGMITQCIKSAMFADKIIVVDSGSKDNTVSIAAALGAEVFSYPNWQGFGEQRNRLLSHCTCDYIYFLDADEIILSELATEIQDVVSRNKVLVGAITWLEVAFGRPLKRMIFKKKIPRLFKKSNLKGFEGLVHECPILIDSKFPYHNFKTSLIHYSRQTIHDSLRKLTQYSLLGAAKRVQNKRNGGIFIGWITAGFMFIKLYFFRLGILEGGPGFLYCLFISLELFFRQAALRYDKKSLSVDWHR